MNNKFIKTEKKVLIVLWILFYNTLIAQHYSFFVAGHVYGAPGTNNIGFHPPFKEKFPLIKNRPEIKFGILTGDIVSPFPNTQDWDEVDNDIDSLGLPVYFSVGNHDMENRPLFESRYGNTYYHFKYENDLFIVLDPNIDGWSISGDQLDYLTNVIDSNTLTSDNIFVFFHQILWKEPGNEFDYIKWNSDAGRSSFVNFWTTIEPLFQNIQNKVYMFAGDLGANWASDVTYDKYFNITFISSGMGGDVGDNFIIVNVNRNKSLTYDLICLTDTNINCLGSLESHLVVNKEPPANLNAIIFPNPTNNVLNIKLPNPIDITFKLYNMTGRLVLEKALPEKQKHNIDVSSVSSGVYMAVIQDGTKQDIIKLMIQ